MRAQEGSRPPAAKVRVVQLGRSTGLRGPGELHLEDGRSIPVDRATPAGLPLGYHDFRPSRGEPTRLIVTPGRCYLPDDLRWWGWAAQLYALRSEKSWGMGDLEDLRQLAQWSAAELGARVIMVNPLGAASPGVPQQPSPYYPSSRRFRNPIYLRIEEAPDLAPLAATARALNQQRRIDRNRVYECKMQALAQLWERFGGDARFEEYCREQGEPLRQFANFCALSEHFRSGWRCWPGDYRDPGSPQVERFADEHAARVRFHQWLQWQVDVQLAHCSEPLAIMQDLPVGVDPEGADAWVWQDVLADGATFGAPPDPFAAGGQDWGLPPFIPHQLSAAGYEPFIQTIRAVLRHAGALRVDHVMGLFRLFWIPQGAPAGEGTYVRYPVDDLLGILALESHRAKAIVVGEDLGTVESGVREKLADLQRAVLARALVRIRSARQISAARHGFHHHPRSAYRRWTLDRFRFVRAAAGRPRFECGRHRQNARAAAGIHRAGGCGRTARGRCARLSCPGAGALMVVTVTLEDALAVEERPNMPSTLDQWPNWSLALPTTLEKLQQDPLPRAIAAALDRPQPKHETISHWSGTAPHRRHPFSGVGSGAPKS